MESKQLVPRTLRLVKSRQNSKVLSFRCHPRPKRPLTKVSDRRFAKPLMFMNRDKQFQQSHTSQCISIELPLLNIKNIQNIQEQKYQRTKSIEKRISIGTLGIIPDDLKLSNFKQGRKLGEGSYSVVKLFERNSVKYACKIFRKPLSSQMIDVIKKQIEILKMLDHQNVVKFHYYFEEKYIQGRTLSGLLKRKLAQNQIKNIFKQIMKAVEYMHSKGVSHRDLKLDNIMIDDNSGRVVIIDFGFGSTNTKRLKMFCGTPSYMCPQIVNRHCYLGDKADIWSLGIILYKMITGNFPFKGMNQLDVFGKISKSKYQVPQKCSNQLYQLLKNMLCKFEQKRMSCTQLLQLKWFS